MDRESLDRIEQSLLDDAFGILRADHRRIEGCLRRYNQVHDESQWALLVRDTLQAIKDHLEIEETIFYPVYLHATNNTIHFRRLLTEHGAERRLLADIAFADPGDSSLETLMAHLEKRVTLHIQEEERKDGLFDAIKAAGVDLRKLGQRLRHYRDNRIASSWRE